jgi:hypothetical protein
VGKVKGGGVQLEFQFPRDQNGKIDLENGEYGERSTQLKMKYEQEARFMMGCCLDLDDNGIIKQDVDGNPLGKLLPLFEYTNTTMVTNKDWLKAFWDTVNAPKKLENPGPWKTSNRIDGAIYDDDPVKTLRGIGARAAEVLTDKGVRTVKELT